VQKSEFKPYDSWNAVDIQSKSGDRLENFDGFFINCYVADPTTNIEGIEELGVDLPILIGKFHFGALDTGLPATGLERVENQVERGIAFGGEGGGDGENSNMRICREK